MVRRRTLVSYLEAWSVAGRQLPRYSREEIPVRYAAAPVNEDFQDVLSALLRAGARFLVVGAHAMAAHGVPRATVERCYHSPPRTL